MFTLREYIIVFVLLLLLLLPLINRIGITCRANQPAFVCYASTSIKTTLMTELVL